jgi:flagellar hook assembly protein FlgD
MNVWSDGNVASIPVSEIKKLTFSDISSAVGNVQINTVIKTFKLLQNYPNPFNPSTTIEYQIPSEGDVEVKIFSVDGQLVKIFQNSHNSQGSYNVLWDGKNNTGQPVASGLYIYRVAFKNSVLAKKMLFVK